MRTFGIYNPYWDTLGGGERYSLYLAIAAQKAGYKVEIYWPDTELLSQLAKRFGIAPPKLSVSPDGYAALTSGSLWRKWKYLKNLDGIFWVSDGSLPFTFAHKNFLHFQVPFHNPSKSFLDQLKHRQFETAMVNSKFTEKVIQNWYRGKTDVVYPPAHMFTPHKKEKIILAVGRFDQTMQSKRQDVLIEAFKKGAFPQYTLVLAGGVLHGTSVVEDLRTKAHGAAIEIIANPDFDKLTELYGQAHLFWHAAGYGVNESTEPEKVEHFGITTVEAMSAGAVPVVYAAGGQKEIVTHQQNGYLWQDTAQLIATTHQLIEDPTLYGKLADSARETSQIFSEEAFIERCIKLIR